MTLVSANVALPGPAAEIVPVGSAEEMHKAVVAAMGAADAVVMAAAVADFRPSGYQGSKIKKAEGGRAGADPAREEPDILAELGRDRRPGQVIVGFAAETDDVLANGRAKLARKGSDLLVVNQVGGRPSAAPTTRP